MNHTSSLMAAQSLPAKPVYHISELFEPAGSRATAYRLMHGLQEVGFAEETQRRGYFTIRSSIFQPYRIWSNLLPSLHALKHARYFGRAYDESDVNYARKSLKGVVTLDYRAYELTGLQTPHRLFIYVEDSDHAAKVLRDNRFSEGKRGRVAILQKDGDFQNEIQRVYFDCLASGGRDLLDAIAIELLYEGRLSVKGEFPAELVMKVKEELPPWSILTA
jgi:hypothetical protein